MQFDLLDALTYRKVIVKTHSENGTGRLSHLVNAALDFSQSIQLLRDRIILQFQLNRI